MGKIGFKIDVDDNGVPADIRKAINRASRKAAKKLAKKLKKQAEGEIYRKDGADSYGIWEGDLVSGFKTKSDGDTARVWNDDEAAGPMETGVSPGAFGARGPPIDNLLPWVRAHFPKNTKFDPWDIGGGDNFVLPGEYKGYDAHHGATSGTGQRFSLPEGDTTQSSEDALSGQTEGSGGHTARGVTDIRPGDTFYARERRAASWKYGTFSYHRGGDGWLVDEKGYRYDPDWFVEYAPDDLKPFPDLDKVKKGDTVKWEFDGDTFEGVVLDPSLDSGSVQVEYNGGRVFIQDELIVDWEEQQYPAWFGQDWFTIPDDQPWDLDDVFYGQEVALWDVNNGDYIRAIVQDFNPDNVLVEFSDSGGGTLVYTSNQRNFRLIGGEKWDNLTDAEQIQSLEWYWDDRVVPRATLDQSRLDFVKDHYFNALFPRIKDNLVTKRTLQMLDEVEENKQNPLTNGFSMGAVAPRDNGRWNFKVLTKKDYDDKRADQIKELQKQGADTPANRRAYLINDYENTINHEFAHAMAHAAGYEQGRDGFAFTPNSGAIEEAFYDIKGEDTINGPSAFAKNLLFKGNGDMDPPLGFTTWREYAYTDALGRGSSSLTDPGFVSSPRTFDRLIETVNRTWWKQVVWAQNEHHTHGMTPSPTHIRFVERHYSTYNPHETFATFTQVMLSDDVVKYDTFDRLEELDKHYPWLLEAWLEQFEPNDALKAKLNSLGYSV